MEETEHSRSKSQQKPGDAYLSQPNKCVLEAEGSAGVRESLVVLVVHLKDVSNYLPKTLFKSY